MKTERVHVVFENRMVIGVHSMPRGCSCSIRSAGGLHESETLDDAVNPKRDDGFNNIFEESVESPMVAPEARHRHVAFDSRQLLRLRSVDRCSGVCVSARSLSVERAGVIPNK